MNPVEACDFDREEANECARRHDAWQRGSQSRTVCGAPLKERLPSKVLVAVIEHRLQAIERVRAEVALGPGRQVAVDRPSPHPRDAHHRTWNVGGFRCGELPTWALQDDFRRIVDGVRDTFDLE